MASEQREGLLDLEKELTCSICTEVLYQPLTLLDCLHTFCGSCLKEWFAWQAGHPSAPHPFTCPSCRANVRATRPNATVTTLLDLLLKSDPSKGKTDEDKEEIAKKYHHGENVLPAIKTQNGGAEESEADLQLLQEVRELSLREVGVAPNEQRTRQHGDTRATERRRHRRQDQNRHGEPVNAHRNRDSLVPEASDARIRAQQLEHQSSLRSLISSSDVDSTEVEEDIIRQIIEAGLLDGVDFSNLDAAREDEISEAIADAIRTRQLMRSRERQRDRSHRSRHHSGSNTRVQTPERERVDTERSRQRTSSATRHVRHETTSHPSSSRTHLAVATDSRTRHRRASSDTRNRTTNPAAAEAARPTARSATDLSEHPRSTAFPATAPDSPGNDIRHSTDFESRSLRSNGRVTSRDGNRDRVRRRAQSQTAGSRTAAAENYTIINQVRANGTSSQSPSLDVPNQRRRSPPSNNYRVVSGQLQEANSEQVPSPRPIISGTATRPKLYPEPQVSCDRCGRSHIEYDRHAYCSKCKDGNYNLCLHCYRSGAGCEHWYGFGHAAWAKYKRQAPPEGYPPDHPLPHSLSSRRYLKPRHTIEANGNHSERKILTSDDPSKRLQQGMFCDICHNLANDCYWKCDVCNDGEWGFCDGCLHQGRCCTHPLLPTVTTASSTPETSSNGARVTKGHMRARSLTTGPASGSTNDSTKYEVMTFSTNCDICTYPIPPSNTRFHCMQCKDGNYDICNNCYLSLISSGKILAENGPKGWRRCPQGHRMIVVGFQDTEVGQKRVIVRDLVGGYALKDDEAGSPVTEINFRWQDEPGGERRSKKTTFPKHPDPSDGVSSLSSPVLARFPPDGGVGMRATSLWSYFPAEGISDELMFPKRAEIHEIEDVNGDWYWGRYAGAKGLFPGNHVDIFQSVGF